MPISPYYKQNGYGIRNYVRSSSSGNLSGMGTAYYSPGEVKGVVNDHPADYFRTKYIIPEDGPAKSYLSTRYNYPQPPPLRSTFQIKRLDSSDNLNERKNPLQENKLKKSSSSSFLTGNTPCYLKSNKSSDSIGRTSPYVPKTRAFTSNLSSPTETTSGRLIGDRNFSGRCGGESSYARAYLDRINKGRDDRPREIDTRDINTSVPRTPKWLKIDKSEDDAGDISRNRQVVRLTIKREKPSPQDPFTIRDKRMQTIAQRLLEKYQVPDKKPDLQEPKSGIRRTFYLDESSPLPKDSMTTPMTITSKTPKPSSSSTPATPVSAVMQNPLALQISSVASGAESTASQSVGEYKEDISLVLQRATNTAETKEELESWQEVKDAIYAAVLHPDVDIESDEEMNKLIEGKPSSSNLLVPEGVRVKLEEPRRDSMDKGLAIMGQLKRFVKQHESAGCSTKESSRKQSIGSNKSEKLDEGNVDFQDNVVSAQKTNVSGQSQDVYAPAVMEASCENTLSKDNIEAINRLEESKTAVRKDEGVSDCSTHKGNKIGMEGFTLENKETTTKASRHLEQCQKKPDQSGNTCDAGEKSQDALRPKVKSMSVSSPLSIELIVGSQSHEHQNEKSHLPGKFTNMQSKIETSPTELELKEAPKDVFSSEILKSKKKLKSGAAMREVSGDTLKLSCTRASPSSGPDLLSPSSSLAQTPHTNDTPREMLKKQSSDTSAQARTTDTQPSDCQMESLSALDTLKSIMREEVECVTAKDFPTDGKINQIIVGNPTSDLTAELETSRDEGTCRNKGHKYEKAVKVKSFENLETTEKSLHGRNLNSLSLKQKEGEDISGIGEKELKTPQRGKKDNTIEKNSNSGIKTKTQTLFVQGNEVKSRIKSDPLTKVSVYPKVLTKDKKIATITEVQEKNKEEDKMISVNDGVTSSPTKSETKIVNDKKTESQENDPRIGHDTSKISADIETKTHKDEGDVKNRTNIDSTDRGRGKEDVTQLKVKSKSSQTSSEGASAEKGPAPNLIPVKRVLKKPRQVTLPPTSEKATANELLQVRNILKRPVKPGATKLTEISKQDSESVKEARVVWKKPLSKLAAPSQVDQSHQVQDVPKRPRTEKSKDEEKLKGVRSDFELKNSVKVVPICTSEDGEGNGNSECCGSTTGCVFRKLKPAYSRSASSSSEDEGSTVRKTNEKTKKIIRKHQNPKEDADNPDVPEPQASTRAASEKINVHGPGEKIKSEEKQVRVAIKDKQKSKRSTEGPIETKGITYVNDSGERQGGVKETTGMENSHKGTVKTEFGKEKPHVEGGGTRKGPNGVPASESGSIPASQSADSGYGSSPCTPYPKTAPTDPVKYQAEEKCEGK